MCRQQSKRMLLRLKTIWNKSKMMITKKGATIHVVGVAEETFLLPSPCTAYNEEKTLR